MRRVHRSCALPCPEGRHDRPLSESGDSGVQNIRSDADLDKLVARASDIRAISVSQGMLTPEGAKRLKEFPSLQLLFFNDSFIDDSVLEAISDLPKSGPSVTQRPGVGDSGLVHVAKLPRLRRIGVVADCRDFRRTSRPGKCPLATGADTHGAAIRRSNTREPPPASLSPRILPSTAGRSRTRA